MLRLSRPSDVEYAERFAEWLDWAVVRAMPMRQLQERSGLSRSTLQAIRAGRRPQPNNATRLTELFASITILTGQTGAMTAPPAPNP